MEGASPTISVTVLNETSAEIDADRWAELVRGVLEREGVEAPAETAVVFVDDVVMAELNAEHMGGSGPTDVLSFPIDDGADDDLAAIPGQARMVGDIVVCPTVAATNAPDHAGDLDDEIALLLIHGSLHLLGHDHAEVDERTEMWAAERRLVAELWGTFPRDPWQET
ncbi:MAG TPA: rRNA maturation RNase YbeY [Microthrixaceae bacterium]|jgi:probable rRNA maturation factor|nr:rRNA maturation RNase YbeY [Microthrixaceae bacterium]HQF94944.1 rRNA maturation RNase YbeY [Microthrixaceae bacterium]